MGQPVVHWEFWSEDPAKISDFYQKVFGWQIRAIPELNYRLVETGGKEGINGGIMKPQAGPWPGKMTFYIDVDDLDQFGKKIRNAGGKIVVEKMEVPGVGAVLSLRGPRRPGTRDVETAEITASNRLAIRATVHCLTGCGIGEVLGMVLGATFSWSNLTTVAVAVALAFVFGYALTLIPLRRSGVGWSTALGLAFAADTLSITLMEVIDNAIMLLIPGAMDAPVTSAMFWGSLLLALLVAGVAAFPLNRWLILRGRGHAVVHGIGHHH